MAYGLKASSCDPLKRIREIKKKITKNKERKKERKKKDKNKKELNKNRLYISFCFSQQGQINKMSLHCLISTELNILTGGNWQK